MELDPDAERLRPLRDLAAARRGQRLAAGTEDAADAVEVVERERDQLLHHRQRELRIARLRKRVWPEVHAQLVRRLHDLAARDAHADVRFGLENRGVPVRRREVAGLLDRARMRRPRRAEAEARAGGVEAVLEQAREHRL